MSTLKFKMIVLRMLLNTTLQLQTTVEELKDQARYLEDNQKQFKAFSEVINNYRLVVQSIQKAQKILEQPEEES